MQRRTGPFVLPVSGGGALAVSKKGRLKRILKRGIARGGLSCHEGAGPRPAEEVTVVFEGPGGRSL